MTVATDIQKWRLDGRKYSLASNLHVFHTLFSVTLFPHGISASSAIGLNDPRGSEEMRVERGVEPCSGDDGKICSYWTNELFEISAFRA
jgi:hypothetical protein